MNISLAPATCFRSTRLFDLHLEVGHNQEGNKRKRLKTGKITIVHGFGESEQNSRGKAHISPVFAIHPTDSFQQPQKPYSAHKLPSSLHVLGIVKRLVVLGGSLMSSIPHTI
ncbi:hypothetical protein QOT17_010811 [Balamuthia mandrillaris]